VLSRYLLSAGSEKRQKLSKFTSILVAICSLVGVLVGASMNYFFTIETQEKKLWAELRTTAYVDYVQNTALSKISEDKELERVNALRDIARFRITLYGSKPVVETLARYETLEYGTPEWEKTSVALFKSIRNELLPKKQQVLDQDIRKLLFPTKYKEKPATGR
jgi:hypothetical protein